MGLYRYTFLTHLLLFGEALIIIEKQFSVSDNAHLFYVYCPLFLSVQFINSSTISGRVFVFQRKKPWKPYRSSLGEVGYRSLDPCELFSCGCRGGGTWGWLVDGRRKE
ncbi:hypothetical protein F4776DRAFT_496187 [Hypoxylon sp. NC0597]|nr:hypothetical protein F4776DRAFT_496187 [Hypoxylon sp. NC0597]